MERLTFEGKFCDIAKCSSTPGGSFCEDGACGWRRVWERLKAYEDTGLEPEDIMGLKDGHCLGCSVPVVLNELRHIQDLLDAEKEGRLVVLDEKRKPLIWGDDEHDTVLCPNCRHDLMGGFPEGESCETPIYQCPFCGQLIDNEKAVTRQEAEEAMGKETTDHA